MGKPQVKIPIHGKILRGFILNKSSISAVAAKLDITRQAVHCWFRFEQINPKHLLQLTNLLSISAEEVRSLYRKDAVATELNKVKRDVEQSQGLQKAERLIRLYIGDGASDGRAMECANWIDEYGAKK